MYLKCLLHPSLPLNLQLFYKLQALKMHNPENWITHKSNYKKF